MKVALATIQTPFIRGGAEYLIEGLLAALLRAGHDTERISIPFRFGPVSEVFRSIETWRCEDFTNLNGHNPDLVICLQFPAYYIRHGCKALWLLHQYRPVYDLWDTSFARAFRSEPQAAGLRDLIISTDTELLRECSRRFTISRNVSERLQRYNGISSDAIYHPPFAAERFFTAPPEPYIFAPSRLEEAKRQELLIRAMASVGDSTIALIAGEGGQSARLHALAKKLNLTNRIRFLGSISEDEKLGLYAHATCVFFAPYDEDYGYVTLEAMLASKPLITCTDSGGPLEFVEHDETGLVVSPQPQEIAAAIHRLFADPSATREMGRAARQRYDDLHLSWDTVVEKLTADPH